MIANINPYLALARLEKPIGIWLLFLPAAWAVSLADGANWRLLALMLLGAGLTRSAGCVINDLVDRRLDAKVARTKNRPLASGALTPAHALAFLAVLLLAALALTLTLPPQVFWLALLALPMIAAYPWMKRLTWWPQLFLGLTFNLGALFGWLATGHPLTLPGLTLYAAGICWTLGYDTIYAIADMEDDAKAGIKSTARRLGMMHSKPAKPSVILSNAKDLPPMHPILHSVQDDTTHNQLQMRNIRWFVGACYTAMLALLLATGWLMGVGWAYYGGLALAAIHAVWQVNQLPCTASRAGPLFCSNQWLGLVIFIGILTNHLAG